MYCDVELVELDLKWRVIVQDCQQQGDSICKVVLKKASRDVELDIKWRVVLQDWQQEDNSLHKFVKKKTSCVVELDIKWRVVVQKSSRRGWLNTQSCLEKDVFWRWISWIRCKVTSHRARLSTTGRRVAQICQEKDVLCRSIRHKMTSRRARLSTTGWLNMQSCLEKGISWRWIRQSDESSCKIDNKRTTHCTNLSRKRRLVPLN